MPTALILMLLAAEAPVAESTATIEPTAAEAEPAELPRLLVIDLKVEEGVSESAVRLLNELLLTKLQTTGKYDVVGQADLRSMLDLEKEKQLTGCSEVSCMAELAGALGAERALFGSVGTIGETYVLNLRLLNNLEAKVEARWSESFEGDEEELVAAVDRAVASLVPVEMVAEEEDRFYQTWWFWTLVGVGVAGTTAGIVAATRSDETADAPLVGADISIQLP